MFSQCINILIPLRAFTPPYLHQILARYPMNAVEVKPESIGALFQLAELWYVILSDWLGQGRVRGRHWFGGGSTPFGRCRGARPLMGPPHLVPVAKGRHSCLWINTEPFQNCDKQTELAFDGSWPVPLSTWQFTSNASAIRLQRWALMLRWTLGRCWGLFAGD